MIKIRNIKKKNRKMIKKLKRTKTRKKMTMIKKIRTRIRRKLKILVRRKIKHSREDVIVVKVSQFLPKEVEGKNRRTVNGLRKKRRKIDLENQIYKDMMSGGF